MPTNSPRFGLPLPVHGEKPNIPKAFTEYTEKLEPLLGEVTSSVVTSQEIAEQAAIEAREAVMLDPHEGFISGQSSYAISFADSLGVEAGGITTEAVMNLHRPLTVRGEVAVTESAPSDTWAFAVTDSGGKVAFGVKSDGSLYPATSSSSPSPLSGDLSKVASDLAGLTISTPKAVTAIGDSLTYGFFDGKATGKDNWVETFKTLVPGVAVTNTAMSGYTVDESGIRSAFVQPLVTVAGGAIPASGEVAITVKDSSSYDWTHRTGAPAVVNIVGTLAGVPGRFKRNSDGGFTFARTSPGDFVPVPDETPFISGYAGHWHETLVIFLGRNNVARNAYGTPAGNVAEHVLAGIKRILDGSTAQVKRALIVSVTTGTWEKRGHAGYQTVQAINALLEEEFPTRFFDLRSYLVNQAIYDLGISPTPADLEAMAGDTLPPSIMAHSSDGVARDGVHYSRDTAKLVGRKIYEQLSMRGWV